MSIFNRQNVLLVGFVTTIFSATAQRIDVQFGAALPNSNFGNTELTKSENAFAKTGYTTGLQADYLVYKNIGLTAKLNYSAFDFNVTNYQNQLNQNPSSTTLISVESNGGYTSTSAMVGGFMTFKKNKLNVDIRLMTGFLTLKDYGLAYTTSYSGQTYNQRAFSQQDATIAFGWGLTARYTLIHNFGISINLDNIYANTSFNKNAYQSSSNETTNKPYQAYLLSVGLGYTLE
jgi:hypothetical protein